MGPHSFALESLEGRTLFSVVLPHATPKSVATAVIEALHAKVKRPHPLAGTFNAVGTFIHDVHPGGNPDVGSPYKFTGGGKTKAMGAFSLTGWVQTPGFIASGTARGRFVLKNSRGSVVLTLVGPPQQPGVLPSTITFKILKGHGIYRHSKGTGQILISASGTTQKFVFRFGPPK
jgi:hypothetical protein